MKKTAALIILVALLPVTVLAQGSAVSLYNRGNELYQDGEYEKAAKTYSEALKSGTENPELYFNRGNALLRAGELGPAIADYLRAKRLAPRDEDIEFNLEFARTLVKGKIEELPKGPFTKAFLFTVNHLSSNEWSALVMALYWGLCGLAVVFILTPDRTVIQKTMKNLIRVFALALVLSLPFAAARFRADRFVTRAVIVSEALEARSGPGSENAKLFDLYEGIDVEVGECDSGWCRIEAPGGFIGWVEAKDFERL